MKNKILTISPFTPSDNVRHAGGKISNYYIKKLSKEENIELRVLTAGKAKEVDECDLRYYGIKHDIKKYTLLDLLKKAAFTSIMYINPFSQWGIFFKYPIYRYYFLARLKNLKKKNIIPDIICLEWTQTALLIDKIKKIYPETYYVIFEHDVSFQRLERQIIYEKGYKKYILRLQRKVLKEKELKSINKADLIVCLNEKDKKILEYNNIEKKKLFTICPYFNDYSGAEKRYDQKEILFYGYMKRKENYLSAIWLIENIYEELKKRDNEIRLCIVGAEPPKVLMEYKRKDIEITGYISDVKKYMEKAMCLAIPLLMGGGIKIKVLEGMSSGLPVITNNIGIEGIPAKKNKDYLHAETKDEFIKQIEILLNKKEFAKEIGSCAKEFIKERYNYEKSYKDYLQKLKEARGRA